MDVFFIDASTLDTIKSGLQNIALTKSIGSDHTEALQWLATQTDEWMLLFDNADDPSIDLYQFFPESAGGNILITSRNPQLSVHAPGACHQVSNMEEDDAVQLLLTSASQDVTDENQIIAAEIVKVRNLIQILHNFVLIESFLRLYTIFPLLLSKQVHTLQRLVHSRSIWIYIIKTVTGCSARGPHSPMTNMLGQYIPPGILASSASASQLPHSYNCVHSSIMKESPRPCFQMRPPVCLMSWN